MDCGKGRRLVSLYAEKGFLTTCIIFTDGKSLIILSESMPIAGEYPIYA